MKSEQELALLSIVRSDDINSLEELIIDERYPMKHDLDALLECVELNHENIFNRMVSLRDGAYMFSGNVLSRAAALGRLSMVESLLQFKFFPVSINSAIYHASKNNQVDVLGQLIPLSYSKGVSGLDTASAQGFYDVVRVLLEAGANPNAVFSAPLASSIMHGHENIAQLLLEYGAESDSPNALKIAVCFGRINILKKLVEEHQADVTKIKSDDLISAAKYGHFETVKYLLTSGLFDFNLQDIASAFVEASDRGQDAMVMYLIEEYPSCLEHKGGIALKQAIKSKHEATADRIYTAMEQMHFKLEEKVKHHALFEAARVGSYKLYRRLLEDGANPKLCNDNGIVFVADEISIVYFNRLLRLGFPEKFIDRDKLYRAVKSGKTAILQFLKTLKVNPIEFNDLFEKKDSVEERLQILKSLLEEGADPNAEDGLALCEACANGHESLVEILLKHVDLNVQNGGPIINACRNGHHDIFNILRAKEANLQVLDHRHLAQVVDLGYLTMVRILLNLNITPTLKIISDASASGKLFIVQRLLAKPSSLELLNVDSYEQALVDLCETYPKLNEAYESFKLRSARQAMLFIRGIEPENTYGMIEDANELKDFDSPKEATNFLSLVNHVKQLDFDLKEQIGIRLPFMNQGYYTGFVNSIRKIENAKKLKKQCSTSSQIDSETSDIESPKLNV